MISVRNLKMVYNNNEVIKNLSVDIGEGEVVSIIGPSGTGKSTFLRCLNLLETPTAGDIFIDGEKITDKNCDLSLVRRKMGMVFQHFNLFENRMVIENVMIAPIDLLKKDKKEAFELGMQLLKKVGLAEKAYSYPSELSGGQKQRAAIARTLAMKPEIILFDEPTSALDPIMVNEVLSVIKQLAKEKLTMLIVTHEMDFAEEVSTRVLYMDEGGIYEDGPSEEIFNHPKREKTRAFIQHIHSYEIKITNRDFDYLHLVGELDDFAKRYYFSKAATNSLQLVVEEMVYHLILPIQPDSVLIDVLITFDEQTSVLAFEINYAGGERNVLEQDDDISVMIVKGKLEEFHHKYEHGMNIITAKMKI